MTGLLHRFRTLPLRSRLALLVATAVAVAVAAVAASCWFVTREQLEHQLDESLKNSTAIDKEYVQNLLNACAGKAVGQRPSPGSFSVQIIATTGEPCAAPSRTGAFPTTDADLAVAAWGPGRPPAHRHRNRRQEAAGLHAADPAHRSGPRLRRHPRGLRRPPDERGRRPPLHPRLDAAVRLRHRRPRQPARPGSGSPVPACAPSTSSPTPSSTSPAPRTSPSGSRSRARTRSPASPVPSTR